MIPIKKRILIFAFISLFALVQGLALAQEAKLSNIIVTNTRDDLLIYLTVEGAFTDKMRHAVESGVPTSFSFYVDLYRSRNMWFAKKLADIEITHTIKYNNLKKEFSISRSWDGNSPVMVQSFAEAQKLMAEINSLKIIPLNMLEKGRQYQIRAKAKLKKLTLPYYLHYVLFFLSLWDFETDWYTIDFIY